jgi:hypothetical protein
MEARADSWEFSSTQEKIPQIGALAERQKCGFSFAATGDTFFLPLRYK